MERQLISTDMKINADQQTFMNAKLIGHGFA